MSKKALKEMSEIIDGYIAIFNWDSEFDNTNKVELFKEGIINAIEQIMWEEGDDTEKQEICDYLRTRLKEQIAKWSN